MKQLIEHIQKSIYNPAYYQELLSRPLSFSFKYYFAFALLLALFLTIISSIPLVGNMNRVLREFPPKFFAYYPDELEVRIEKGIVSSNVTEPYFLPIPKEFGTGTMMLGEGIEHVAVIDTTHPVSLEQFNEHRSVIWIAKEAIVIMDDKGGVRIKQFDPSVSGKVNESVLRDLEQRAQPYYRFISPILVLAIFLGLLVAFCVNFIYLIIGALFIMLLCRVIGHRFNYKESYQVGLHAMTLPLLVNTVLAITPLSLSSVPFLTTAIMLVVVYMNFVTVTPRTTAAAVPPAPPPESPKAEPPSAPPAA